MNTVTWTLSFKINNILTTKPTRNTFPFQKVVILSENLCFLLFKRLNRNFGLKEDTRLLKLQLFVLNNKIKKTISTVLH